MSKDFRGARQFTVANLLLYFSVSCLLIFFFGGGHKHSEDVLNYSKIFVLLSAGNHCKAANESKEIVQLHTARLQNCKSA